MKEKVQLRRFGEITIHSDWITTIGMAVLFVVTAVFVVWDIRRLTSGRVIEQASFSTAILALYCFAFAFSIKAKTVKLAFVFIGASAACRAALVYLHASSSLQRFATVGGLILNLVGYAIISVAIVRWFGSVVHRNPQSDPDVSDS